MNIHNLISIALWLFGIYCVCSGINYIEHAIEDIKWDLAHIRKSLEDHKN